MKPLWVIGAGGHAKVVIDTARSTGQFEVVGLLDDNEDRWGRQLLGAEVRGAASREVTSGFGIGLAVIAIGSNRARAEVAQRLDGLVTWASLVHPTAHLSPGVHIGEGSVAFAGAIVQPDSVIGRYVILNTACSVDHDVTIGDFVHIAPGVRLAGNVRVEVGALIGIGCSVAPGCTIGAWATIGAGSVVVHDIPPGVTAKGVPAKYPKTRSMDAIAGGPHLRSTFGVH